MTLRESRTQPGPGHCYLRSSYMKGRTSYVRTYECTYVCTNVHDVMAIKPNFLTSMGYHTFLAMVLRARAPSAPLIFPLYVVYSRDLKNILSIRVAE